MSTPTESGDGREPGTGEEHPVRAGSSDGGSDEAAWRHATWDGSRRRQLLEFLALPFREKLRILEEKAEVAVLFEARGVREPSKPNRTRAAASGWSAATLQLSRCAGFARRKKDTPQTGIR